MNQIMFRLEIMFLVTVVYFYFTMALIPYIERLEWSIGRELNKALCIEQVTSVYMEIT